MEFETFELKKKHTSTGEFNKLLSMKINEHTHFTVPDIWAEKKIRVAVSKINRDHDGEAHFGVHRVGPNDPKGEGIRVLRDDKPTRVRRSKTQIAAE